MAAAADYPAQSSSLVRWKTRDPSIEVRISEDRNKALLQLYNTARAEVMHAKNLYFPIAKLRRCVQKFERAPCECRLFENEDPQELDAFLVDLAARRLEVFQYKNCSKARVEGLKLTKTPVFQIQDRPISFALSTDEPANLEDRWKRCDAQSDVGIVRVGPDGSEEELIRFEPGKGHDEFEDVRVLRTKRGEQEELICELFHRATGVLRKIDLFEGQAHQEMTCRIVNIQDPAMLPSIAYDQLNAPESAAFVDTAKILFAEGKDLRKLSVMEVEQEVIQYLTGVNAAGKRIGSYGVHTLKVKKMFDQTDFGRKPIISIHLQSNLAITAVKSVISLIESLFNIGDTPEYCVDRPLGQVSTETLILRNSEMTQADTQIPWEEFKVAFKRCGVVDIKIACDRTVGELTCDGSTWTKTAAGFGRGYRAGAIQLFKGGEKDPSPETEAPSVATAPSPAQPAVFRLGMPKLVIRAIDFFVTIWNQIKTCFSRLFCWWRR